MTEELEITGLEVNTDEDLPTMMALPHVLVGVCNRTDFVEIVLADGLSDLAVHADADMHDGKCHVLINPVVLVQIKPQEQ